MALATAAAVGAPLVYIVIRALGAGPERLWAAVASPLSQFSCLGFRPSSDVLQSGYSDQREGSERDQADHAAVTRSTLLSETQSVCLSIFG